MNTKNYSSVYAENLHENVRRGCGSLSDVIAGAGVFIGLSGPNTWPLTVSFPVCLTKT